MIIQIEKITNGYVVTIDGKKTFYDVPEAICGLTSEWVLAECERLDKVPDPELNWQVQIMKAQQEMAKTHTTGATATGTAISSALSRLYSWVDRF